MWLSLFFKNACGFAAETVCNFYRQIGLTSFMSFQKMIVFSNKVFGSVLVNF